MISQTLTMVQGLFAMVFGATLLTLLSEAQVFPRRCFCTSSGPGVYGFCEVWQDCRTIISFTMGALVCHFARTSRGEAGRLKGGLDAEIERLRAELASAEASKQKLQAPQRTSKRCTSVASCQRHWARRACERKRGDSRLVKLLKQRLAPRPCPSRIRTKIFDSEWKLEWKDEENIFLHKETVKDNDNIAIHCQSLLISLQMGYVWSRARARGMAKDQLFSEQKLHVQVLCHHYDRLSACPSQQACRPLASFEKREWR
eukprot:Skav227234  [mRNA]  locus=scaffold2789:55877:58861:- [translate_table: standard]